MTGDSPESARPAHARIAQDGPDLTGYETLVAVCGGIAAFKTAALVSQLVQRGSGVTVAMTRAARRFVGPLTFRALTARPVYTSIWQCEDPADQQHLGLTERADLLIVAPATANMLAKAAQALGDDLVSTLLLSAASPVLMAPAMNTRMWTNPLVQDNVSRLRAAGVHLVDPTEGWLACRAVGRGRMAEPDAIIERAVQLLTAGKPKAAAR